MRRFVLILVLCWGLLSAFPVQAAWQNDWDNTVEAARKEGQVSLYVSDVFYEVFQDFQKRFPNIKVVTVAGRGSQIAQRVMAERRAGKYLADVYIGGSGTVYNIFYEGKVLSPLKPLLVLPEVLDRFASGT